MYSFNYIFNKFKKNFNFYCCFYYLYLLFYISEVCDGESGVRKISEYECKSGLIACFKWK